MIAHQRSADATPDFLPALQRELIAVISKYVKVSADDIRAIMGGNVQRLLLQNLPGS